MRGWVRAGGGTLEPLQVVRKIDGGKGVCNLGYAKFICPAMHFEMGKIPICILSLTNLHTVSNPKRVLYSKPSWVPNILFLQR